MPKNLERLYKQLANTVADIVDHPDCPKTISDCLGDMATDLLNSSNILDGSKSIRLLFLPSLNSLSSTASNQSNEYVN